MRMDIRNTFRSKSASSNSGLTWDLVPKAVRAYIRNEEDTIDAKLQQRRNFAGFNVLRIRFERDTATIVKVEYKMSVRLEKPGGDFDYPGVFHIEMHSGSYDLVPGAFAAAVVATLDGGLKRHRDEAWQGFSDLLEDAAPQ